ncbi:hypothetical protein PoB_002399600 [Plakobranchus ocellatus]|uniref:Uncharacterized protein n=1 Tax=Plakobranchus ocellatus TaxID=259542 RepID=A0AAV3ZE24_9GAST|nr:hypothetical protein PoB_002399600 [Plakobranchus ocellatus]
MVMLMAIVMVAIYGDGWVDDGSDSVMVVVMIRTFKLREGNCVAQAYRCKRTPVLEDSKNMKSRNRPKCLPSSELHEHRRRLKERESKPLPNETFKSHMKDAREKARKTPAGENWLVARNVYNEVTSQGDNGFNLYKP